MSRKLLSNVLAAFIDWRSGELYDPKYDRVMREVIAELYPLADKELRKVLRELSQSIG